MAGVLALAVRAVIPDEILSQPHDKNPRAIPKEGARRRAKDARATPINRRDGHRPSGQAALWATRETVDFSDEVISHPNENRSGKKLPGPVVAGAGFVLDRLRIARLRA